MLRLILVSSLIIPQLFAASPQKNAADTKSKGSVAVDCIGDMVITDQDIESAVKLKIMQMPEVGKDMMDVIRTQAHQELRDALIKTYAAKKSGMTLPKGMVEERLNDIAKSNRMASWKDMRNVLKQGGDKTNVWQRLIEANMIWMEYIRRAGGHLVKVNDAEVEKRMERWRKSNSQTRYEICEIVLRGGDAAKIAGFLKSRLQDPAIDFETLAEKYSQSPAAANRGYRGWCTRQQLDQELSGKADLNAATVGSVIGPVQTAGDHYRLLYVKDVQKANEASFNSQKISFIQIRIPLRNEDGSDKIEEVQTMVSDVMAINGKAALSAWAREKGLAVEEKVAVTYANLPDGMKKLLIQSGLNKLSTPVNTGEELLMFMVTNKESGKIPDENDIRKALTDEIRQTKMMHYAESQLNRWRQICSKRKG